MPITEPFDILIYTALPIGFAVLVIGLAAVFLVRLDR